MLIIFSLLLLVEGTRLTWHNAGVVTSAMEISWGFQFAAVPAGGALMLLRSVQLLIDRLRGHDDPHSTHERATDSPETSL